MMKRVYSILLILIFALYSSAFTSVLAQSGSTQRTVSSVSTATGTAQKTSLSLPLTLPLREGSVRFLAMGDSGRGNREQNELAQVMVKYRQAFPFNFVIMTGDNIYYQESAQDMKTKFEDVYRTLLNDGVKFYASLGNHDESNQRFYEHFNMNGQEYFKFKKGDVSFYSLNSNYMEPRQLQWLKEELAKDTAKWQIAFFHHPLYSSGKRHGPSEKIREVVEPLFVQSGIDVVFVGHEHFYERIKPQKGIYHLKRILRLRKKVLMPICPLC
jgi:predicted phosphodiesterase